MPKFYSRVWVDVEVDMHPDEFLDKCSKEDIEEVIEYLTTNHFIYPSSPPPSNLSFDEEQLHKNLDAIKANWYVLSKSDEELIKKIASKL